MPNPTTTLDMAIEFYQVNTLIYSNAIYVPPTGRNAISVILCFIFADLATLSVTQLAKVEVLQQQKYNVNISGLLDQSPQKLCFSLRRLPYSTLNHHLYLSTSKPVWCSSHLELTHIFPCEGCHSNQICGMGRNQP